ncbi:hypothetical protein PMZ80_002521 [Knufia obscura]|uniref:Uncharacterized protein n=2 Tax=Knufia TaxID=430999 RepID=A0AAN8ECA8_9EURO|nr:hypothetical protein PMZ80_002521 [Knufia obscura]KAK5950770.1 hypothetical protein OHC33_008153 [Knufia fluminis]
MPRNIFKGSNKSQASLDKIADSRDHSQVQIHSNRDRDPHRDHSPSAQADTASYPPQSQSQLQSQQQYGGPAYHQVTQSQQQQQQHQYQSQIPQDERYYHDQPQSQSQPQSAPPHSGHPPHLLSRSSSSRLPPGQHPPVNAYQEQQQLQSQRPTISLVHPNLQQESIAEDQLHEPGRTQFGAAQTIRTSGPKEEKRSRNSGIRGFFSSGKDKKEGRDSPVDQSRLSRHTSVLRKASQQGPTSPQQQYPQPSPRLPQSPQQGQGQTHVITNHPQNNSQEELSDDQRDEGYYKYPRPNSQFGLPQQEQRRPSVPYEEDAPRFPPPPQAPFQQQIYQQPNTSQQQIESQEDQKGFFPYTGQPIRDRPSAVFAVDESLRPPSQSSLGPPSPLAGPPAQLAPRTNNPPRYSVQSIQAYQAAQQAANQIQAQNSGQGQGQQPSPQDQEEMPNRDRQQRDSRMDDNDQRYAAQQDPRVRMSTAGHEQGRSTPPPRGRDDIQSLDHQTLLLRYEELQAKYSKVKRYYFDREAQVTQLQNTVANQRLSMSKTSLDDAQYATRFERLNGAIQNLAFNIRKDWRRVPNWLTPACNRDACQTGTKEMTAVGRACISRWLYEHIFQEIFHPGIDPTLSAQLKQMERTLRRTPSILTEEQRDDLLTKVTTWRLTTCEGLNDVLNSRQMEAYTENLSHILADQLCEYLRTLLADPPPPNLEGYLLPIVAQTLSIAANLPLESRDICIECYHPGTPINEIFMKLETGMTPLTNPGSAPSREDYEDAEIEEEQNSINSTDEPSNVEDQIREAAKAATTSTSTIQQTASAGSQNSNNNKKEKKSGGGFFSGGFSGGLVSKKPPPSSSRGPSTTDLAGKDKSSTEIGAGGDEGAWNLDVMTRGAKEGKIRFAVFLAVEVRGKSVKGEQGQGGSGNGGEQVKQGENGGGGGSGNGSNGNGSASAGPGVGTQSNTGTSGGAGTGGVNVLVKAPVFGF